MVSNALTSRRSFFRRPKVCKTPSAAQLAADCPPSVPLCSCTVSPARFSIPFNDADTLDVSVCKPVLPHGDAIWIMGRAFFGSLGHSEHEVTNCDNVGSFPYSSPDFVCLDRIIFTIRFSDGLLCYATAVARVFAE